MIYVELLRDVVKQIVNHPETWDQTVFHSSCGTAHCVAGWAAVMEGKFRYSEISNCGFFTTGQKLLGLTDLQAHFLFAGCATLDEIVWFLEKAEECPEGNFEVSETAYLRDRAQAPKPVETEELVLCEV